MQLLVVRHAIAEDRLEWAARGLADDERPLTARGHARMKRGAAGLATLVPSLDLIATSPVARAAQTAALLARPWRGVPIVEVAFLGCGGSREDLVEWLGRRGEGHIAVVGHEPDLGRLVFWLLTGEKSGAVAMRKGGACLLAFDGTPSPGGAALRWFLPPSVLRRLAR